MKKIMSLGFVFYFVFVSLWITPARGEDYVSKKFSSDEILTKELNSQYEECTVVKFVGKHQNADGSYKVYYLYTCERSEKKYNNYVVLTKLDTNVWIINPNFRRSVRKILQK